MLLERDVRVPLGLILLAITNVALDRPILIRILRT